MPIHLQDMIKVLNTGHPKITELKVHLFVRFEYQCTFRLKCFVVNSCIFFQAAEEMVKFQLRHGNDLLAWDSLRGCDVSVGRIIFFIQFIFAPSLSKEVAL